MALGALPRDVVSLNLRQGLVLVGAGMAAGVAIAVPLRSALGGLLFLTGDTAPVVFLAVTLALAVVAVPACYLPAHRAMRVDPMVALRHE
jgi:putative ABC transport system permease protein